VKRRVVDALHRIANPIARRLQSQAVVETRGRISGKLRHTPVGGRLDGNTYWFISMHGESSNYARNIKADNAVRVRIHGRWRTGHAYLLPDDDADARNAKMSWVNRTANSGLGSELLTVRVDLE
jgi:deazaflavin-dependent oxidoreductase (nitroreductase family)